MPALASSLLELELELESDSDVVGVGDSLQTRLVRLFFEDTDNMRDQVEHVHMWGTFQKWKTY